MRRADFLLLLLQVYSTSSSLCQTTIVSMSTSSATAELTPDVTPICLATPLVKDSAQSMSSFPISYTSLAKIRRADVCIAPVLPPKTVVLLSEEEQNERLMLRKRGEL
jgi:hypothetical protein